MLHKIYVRNPLKSWKIIKNKIKFMKKKKFLIFKSYASVYIGKINETQILIIEKTNREIPGSFYLLRDTSRTKIAGSRELNFSIVARMPRRASSRSGQLTSMQNASSWGCHWTLKILWEGGLVPITDVQKGKWPFRNGHVCMKNVQCAETNEKSILQFLFVGLWSIVFIIFFKYLTLIDQKCQKKKLSQEMHNVLKQIF